MKYRTIVADPPWQVEAGPVSLHAAADGYRTQAAPCLPSRQLTYATMTVADIATLPVNGISNIDAHLYLWTINAYVEEAYSVARAWGFKPSILLVWAKAPKGRGLGGTYANATEYVLFARRGSLAAKIHVDRNWWEWKRREHSAKPEHFYDLVESVSPGPYVELFSRRHRMGWDVYGNESANTATLEPAS